MPEVVTSTPQTPLMRQYAEAKKRYPEALLLFRLGDFYELFFEDAVTAARELQITLTSRNKEKGTPIPMCGVPYHAAENYIAKLIQKGFKVALCEQMEDPKLTKTLVRREVTRLITPGTAGLQLGAGDNAYLAAVAHAPGGTPRAGLALLDLSTGEFRATEFVGGDMGARLSEELGRWRPREVLHAAEAPLFRAQRPEELDGAALTPLEAWQLTPDFGQRVLESHFGVLSLEGFGLGERPWAAAAAGALIHYVKETQRSQIAHVDRVGYFERQEGLVLDAVTARNLELVEPLFQGGAEATLRAVLDQTMTPMGKRLLRQWILRPSGNREEIEGRLDGVGALVQDWQARAEIRQVLGGVQDLERLLGRIALETASPRDLAALCASLERLPDLRLRMERHAGRWRELAARLNPLPDLCANIGDTIGDEPPAQIDETGFIRAGKSAELDELRSLSHGAKTVIAQIEARERTRTSIGSLKVRFNNIFGYFIEVSKPNLALVPADYERKQTMVNAERFTTPELKDLEVKILTAEEKALALERAIFHELRAAVNAETAAIRGNGAALAEIDVLANFAHLAAEQRYCRPEMGAAEVEIRQGRHPVVERLGWEGGADRFVANDLFLDEETQRLLILTGPNMGGKSTYLRQAALMAVMAQMGSFVPAEKARLPLFDRVFTRIGASDNLARGRSTFMVEMTEAAVILNQATAKSLVILDEIGRGTATYDGLSLAWAIIEHLQGKIGAKTLFATHYHELTELAACLPAVRNAHVAVKESGQGVVFLRKVEAGEANRSYGIEVARLAGLPRNVIERAREVLQHHERAERQATTQLETPGAVDPKMQLTLFTPLSQQVVEQLAEANLNEITPMDALRLLDRLQQQIGKG